MHHSILRDVSPLGIATLSTPSAHSRPPRLDIARSRRRWHIGHFACLHGRDVAVDLCDGTTMFGRVSVARTHLVLRLFVADIPCRLRIPFDQVARCRATDVPRAGFSLLGAPRLTWRRRRRAS